MCALTAEPEGTAEAAEAETPAETEEVVAPSEDQLEAGAEDLASGTWSQAVRQAFRYTRWT